VRTIYEPWRIEVTKYRFSLAPLPLQERMMRGYGVGTQGFFLLEERFGQGFENFVLLDDIAIEACTKLIIPTGERLGTIELDEMGGLAIQLFARAYYAEA
jgi:hypothetical protein